MTITRFPQRLKLSALVVLVCLTALHCWPGQTAHGRQTGPRSSRPAQIDFNRDIRPILSDKCFACHGPDAPAKRIKLRLDSEAAALAELGRGRRAIVPGHTEQSELVHRITAEDELERMPPVSSGRRLSPREIELLTEWIRQGAKWGQHWAYVAPTRPPLPQVKDAAWPKNAIDYFVLAKLEREGLQPSPAADRATLLRRVTFDLTGLPPTLKELDDFLNDPSPDAYEKVVDRLLASPRYGERMAFRWLDAARYADTNGYQIDGERSMWRWRDWVIEAFNANKPFDQFTVEQLAGDLLPNPTLDQKIATGFNRNHRGNSEDGLVPEEYFVEYVVDRVDTTSTVFQGLTLGCARCHNHKYDPFTQKEYYQLFAYFNSIREDGRVPNFWNAPPFIYAPTRPQQRQLAQMDAEIAQTDRRLHLMLRQSSLAQRRWEQTLRGTRDQQWFPHDRLLLHHALDESAKAVIDESALAATGASKPDARRAEIAFKDGVPSYVASPLGQAVRFDGRLYFDAGGTANFDYRDRVTDYKDKFAISAWFYAESENSGAIVTRMKDEAGGKENGLPKNKGYGVYFINGKIHFNLVGVWADDSYRVETEKRLSTKQWHHVLATFDGTLPYERVQLYVDGQHQTLKINNDRLFRTFSDASLSLRIGGGGGPEYRFKGMIDEVRIYSTLPDEGDRSVLACSDSLDRIVAIPASRRSLGQRLKLQYAWLDGAAPASVQQPWKRLRELKQQRDVFATNLPTVMVMQELESPRPAHLLKRGAYDAPGELVERNTPAVLPSMPLDFPKNRLGLAKWITSRENPLTARVTVNRFWQMLFGTGLVKTVDDFGSQGELPSHPELLDWLAVEFRDGGSRYGMGSGSDLVGSEQRHIRGNPLATARGTDPAAWNVKALLKTIVMSATYRQSSKLNPQSVDPENRLLARGPRYRLSAGMIRDQALFASGLLVEKLGGESVRPYQPEGLWKDMTFSNMTNYSQSKGEGLWRRSLYSYWRRTILLPNMGVFDASARELCTVREARTNTPLQALDLMNDVTYVEAARMLAERAMQECRNDPRQRLAWAFRVATSRPPSENEQKLLLKSFQAQLEHFRAQPEEARKLLAIGERRNDERLNQTELAAYAMTASLILNLDEAITKQ
jgi:hypothetical protein